MQGSSLVAFLAGVPCPNCGNERGIELHAVYSTGSAMLSGRTFHCFSLNCPVCHHGNSWPVTNGSSNGVVAQDSEVLPQGPGIEQVSLLKTQQYYGQLGLVARLRYGRMLVKLGMGELRKTLRDRSRQGTHD